ncbi:GAF domain-containing protein [Saccharopolyspora indica]|uniref:GAF domain-containing protein n=1 Tax=Saccharopolyspora indica TaxID=1229659 RepID=UPI0022EAA8B3|nr:GAF domain-containing protein [Saccharopolyspora indica]MDA3647900.1 GAF domain-containing protein [Saccharopolyspora indica]
MSLPHDPASRKYPKVDGHRLLLPPEDVEAAARSRRLRELGISSRPIPEFDEFAGELAATLEAPFAMVNFMDDDRQYFAGLHVTRSGTASETEPAPPLPADDPMRTMDRDHGYCVYVAARRRALVLHNIRDYAPFSGNPVADEIGVRAYLGAPLIDRTGTALGTICVVDQVPREWGREGLEIIKRMAAQLVSRIERGEYTTS